MLKAHFENKSEFRKSCVKRLKFTAKITKIKKNSVISSKIEKVIKQYSAKNILLYLPLEFEVDLTKLISKLRKDNKCKVFVPFIIGESFIPVPFRFPLEIKKFKIKEPNFSSLKPKIDLVVVPVVGIDGDDRRIGFGKGMYDRYFGSLKKRPIIVFTQLTLCKTSQFLGENHDIKADLIII